MTLFYVKEKYVRKVLCVHSQYSRIKLLSREYVKARSGSHGSFISSFSIFQDKNLCQVTMLDQVLEVKEVLCLHSQYSRIKTYVK